MDKIDVLNETCDLVMENKIDTAKKIIENKYKHEYINNLDKRSMSKYERLKIFLNDGFIDRYTGKKLLFPNVLRILSYELGNVFPFHANWKMSDCHIAYWEYIPTYDHIIPIARGGKDIPENIVTTSMIMNSAKSSYLMEEIGIKLYEKGDLKNWNGKTSWYLQYIQKNDSILNDKYILSWHNALTKCINVDNINIS